jgi:hypothetical protein
MQGGHYATNQVHSTTSRSRNPQIFIYNLIARHSASSKIPGSKALPYSSILFPKFELLQKYSKGIKLFNKCSITVSSDSYLEIYHGRHMEEKL